jgi:hypothetical protein
MLGERKLNKQLFYVIKRLKIRSYKERSGRVGINLSFSDADMCHGSNGRHYFK